MPNLNTEFWNLVGKEASVDEVKVGDAVRLEAGNVRQVVIVVEAWNHPEKGRQVKFRQVADSDVYDDDESMLTIIVDNSLAPPNNISVKREA